MTVTPESVEPTPMLDTEAVATVLRISDRHLRNLRKDDPSFPTPRMVGTLPRWTYQSIHDWVEAPSRTNHAPDAENDTPASVPPTGTPSVPKSSGQKAVRYVH